MDEKQMIFYLYRITNRINNKIYIGCHQTQNINDGYMGSGKYIKRAIDKHGIENFYKEILAFFSDAESMFAAEARVVTREFIEEDSNYNLAEGGKGGHKGKECYSSPERSQKIREAALGTATVIDLDGNKFRVDRNDPRIASKELVGHTKGFAMMKGADGKTVRTTVDDPRIQSGELVGVSKGLAMMKDCLGNKIQVPKNDPRIKSGELVGVTKGHTQTAESNAKRSAAQKGIPKPQTFASCVVCQKTTSITNLIRWHHTRCFSK